MNATEVYNKLSMLTLQLWWPKMTYFSQFLDWIGPEVIKLFFNLNSAEHEIYPAYKC